MKTPHTSRRRLAVGAIAAGLLLAACGGGDDGGDSSDADSDGAGAETPAPSDEVEVTPEADAASNQLPDVVVDDLIAGNQVNVRNLAPNDKPILLWMYAPH